MKQTILPPPPEMRVCKCCGRELPIDSYRLNRWGTRNQTCNGCVALKYREARKAKKVSELDSLRQQLAEARQLRLQDFQPRELMLRLRELGYEGTLTYIEKHTIDITKMN